MDTAERRAEILKLLQMDMKPMSASRLAERFSVSRQIIVGDVALLRASGVDVVSTARGYILNKTGGADELANDSYVIACRHDKGLLEAELYAIVDNGGILLNVMVDHPIYGAITEPLEIRSRYEADTFLKRVAVTGASLLCSVTDGVHMHTIRCPDAESYKRILVALKNEGVIYTK